jgi:hypothetical protein
MTPPSAIDEGWAIPDHRSGPFPIVKRTFHFEGQTAPLLDPQPTVERRSIQPRRDPIVLAYEWQDILDQNPSMSRAELARQLGVSRARVTQVLARINYPSQFQG